MANKSIKITIDSALNASGFKQAEVELHKLGKNFKGSISSLKTIAAGIFAIPGAFKQGKEWGDAIFKNIIAPFMKSKGLINDVSESSEKFIDMISKANADGLSKIADEYKSITSSAKSAADSRQRELRYMHEQLKLLHDVKDAEAELAKQRKLATLAPDDANGRAMVEQEFAASAGLTSAMRLEESAVLKRQELEKEAEAAKKAAEEIDGVVSKLEKRLRSAKTLAGTLASFSTMRNEKDFSWKNLFGISRTSAGDEVREKQKKAAEDAAKEVAKIEADISAKKNEAAKLRSESDDAIRRREALWSQIEMAEVRIEAERLKNADAVAKIEADNQKVVEEAKKRALEFENQRTESLAEYKKKLESIFGESVSIDIEEPKAVDIKVRETGIAEVKKAFDALRTAKTNDEIKSAKKSLDIAIKSAKEELEGRRDGMKKLHDERMKQLDKEQAKVQKNIDEAKAKGFDNIMATAGGGAWGQGTLDQAGEEQARRQRIIGGQRAADAEAKLREKMAKVGATLDDPTKLGRMSNLERAAFERLKLKDAEAKAARIQKEKDEREKKMVKNLDEINMKLKEVGL